MAVFINIFTVHWPPVVSLKVDVKMSNFSVCFNDLIDLEPVCPRDGLSILQTQSSERERKIVSARACGWTGVSFSQHTQVMVSLEFFKAY